MTFWRGKSASELGRAIGSGELSPVWLTEEYFAAIHAHPAGDRIYARLTEARAVIDRAREAGAESARPALMDWLATVGA